MQKALNPNFSLSQRKVHVKYFRNLKRMKLIYAFTRIGEHWPSGVTTEILFFWETHQSLDFPFSHSSSRIHILECSYITTTCVPYSMTCLEYRPVEAVLVRALMHRCPLFLTWNKLWRPTVSFAFLHICSERCHILSLLKLMTVTQKWAFL